MLERERERKKERKKERRKKGKKEKGKKKRRTDGRGREIPASNSPHPTSVTSKGCDVTSRTDMAKLGCN